MQQLTKIAAHRLKEKWSNVEDLFRAAAAAVHHLKKCSQPFTSEYSNQKRVRIPPPPPNLLSVRVAVTVLGT